MMDVNWMVLIILFASAVVCIVGYCLCLKTAKSSPKASKAEVVEKLYTSPYTVKSPPRGQIPPAGRSSRRSSELQINLQQFHMQIV